MKEALLLLTVAALAGCAAELSDMPIPHGKDWYFLAAPPLEVSKSVSVNTHTTYTATHKITTTTTTSRHDERFRGFARPPRRRSIPPRTVGHPRLLVRRPGLARRRFRPLEVLP